jgi:hypothetical protein
MAELPYAAQEEIRGWYVGPAELTSGGPRFTAR